VNLFLITAVLLYVVASGNYTYYHAFRLRFMQYHHNLQLREETDAFDALAFALKWAVFGPLVAPFIMLVWAVFEIGDRRLPQPYRREVREAKALAAELFRARNRGVDDAEFWWCETKDLIDRLRKASRQRNDVQVATEARATYERVRELAGHSGQLVS
jgi:hypothetical protein